MSLRRRTRSLYLGIFGVGVRCPICGHRAPRFLPHASKSYLPARPNARCEACGSLERHRLFWLVLTRHGRRMGAVLHFAPEPFLAQRLRTMSSCYVSFDISSARGVDIRGDATRLPFRDATFDVVLCSHVLEHVRDDAQAMREMRRVLRPGGWAVVDVPLLSSNRATLEDLHADVRTRREVYLQEDHVRLYGTDDFPDRLVAAGFSVEVLSATDIVGRGVRRRGIQPDRVLHLCR